MKSEKINFTKEKETLLSTLYCRAMQSKVKNPILRDPWAEEAVSRIDYDFTKFKSTIRVFGISIRARKFDTIVNQFLFEHPDAVVLYLGCGMDSRVFRVDPPAGVQWFDVDYPDVIELRKRLYPDRTGYRMIGTSLAELSWLDEIPADRPALIIAEGVTMYLTEEIMRSLLNRLTSHFSHGEIAFDTHSRKLIQWMSKKAKTVHGTGAAFHWGIDHPDEVTKLEPRLEFAKEFKTSDIPGYSAIPFHLRVLSRMLVMIPALRRALVPLVYRF